MNSYSTLLKFMVSMVLIIGIYLHTSRLVFSPELVIQHLLTREFDMVFVIPMVISTILLWTFRSKVIHHGMISKVIYNFITIYFTISVPLHFKSFFANNVDQFKIFPGWYSLIILPILNLMLIFVLRLQFLPYKAK
ncbi:hypothetical protein [Leptospira limi]|uniref:Acyltransferase n=1 Tax=Leptospira limi TaxID=2950023 RepID=A0ABT3M1D5_9LEPT|nr:hypothetical protein [Leptospira limi]MCW7463427.1 hypothetical protein [Leptospira limi]